LSKALAFVLYGVPFLSQVTHFTIHRPVAPPHDRHLGLAIAFVFPLSCTAIEYSAMAETDDI
jgi:hypothetical protein